MYLQTCNMCSPSVKHAALRKNFNKSTTYSVFTTIKYSCNEGFQAKGNSNSSCMYSGEWSTPPQCLPEIKSTIHPLVVVVPVVLLLFSFLSATILIKRRCKLNTKRQHEFKIEQVELDGILMEVKGIVKPIQPLERKLELKRNNYFDAFVLYHFDTDDNFILNQLFPELEGMKHFKLCIHSRNFTPGKDIKDNIEESINNSNSAIIVMSQGFVDSVWCKEEFTHCYIENMNDDSFKLFIIMMQPADTLINISPYMKTLFANKTYLQVNDQELFSKLSKLVENLRQPERDDADNYVDDK